jgi:hypothetical protein
MIKYLLASLIVLVSTTAYAITPQELMDKYNTTGLEVTTQQKVTTDFPISNTFEGNCMGLEAGINWHMQRGFTPVLHAGTFEFGYIVFLHPEQTAIGIVETKNGQACILEITAKGTES